MLANLRYCSFCNIVHELLIAKQNASLFLTLLECLKKTLIKYVKRSILNNIQGFLCVFVFQIDILKFG